MPRAKREIAPENEMVVPDVTDEPVEQENDIMKGLTEMHTENNTEAMFQQIETECASTVNVFGFGGCGINQLKQL